MLVQSPHVTWIIFITVMTGACSANQNRGSVLSVRRAHRLFSTRKKRKEKDSLWFSYILTNTITSKERYTPYNPLFFVVLKASNLYGAELKLKPHQQGAAGRLPPLRFTDQWASVTLDQTQKMAASLDDDFESANQDYYSLLNVRKEVRFIQCCTVTPVGGGPRWVDY